MTQITSMRRMACDARTAYETAKNIERFPEFMPDLESATIVDRLGDGKVTSRWEGRVSVGPLKRKIKWAEKDFWDDENLVCTFDLIEGDMKEYSGTWTFTPEDKGCVVELKVDFEMGIPLLGPMVTTIINQVMQDNCDALVEALERLSEN